MHDAYLAGLIDGEGSIMLLGQGKRRSRAPQIQVSIKERNVLEAIMAEHGGYITQAARAAVPSWRLGHQAALATLRRVRPYLRIERRKALTDLLIEDPLICRADIKNNPVKIYHNERVFQQMRKRNAKRLPEAPSYAPRRPAAADYHYLAGILDGEGYICFSDRRKIIEVTSTDPELPAWLRSRFGGRLYSREARGPRQRPQARWVRSATGCKWAARVADLMLLERKADALRQMQDYEYVPERPSLEPTPFDAEYKRLREEGVVKTVAIRESGIPRSRADRLEATLGL